MKKIKFFPIITLFNSWDVKGIKKCKNPLLVTTLAAEYDVSAYSYQLFLLTCICHTLGKSEFTIYSKKRYTSYFWTHLIWKAVPVLTILIISKNNSWESKAAIFFLKFFQRINWVCMDRRLLQILFEINTVVLFGIWYTWNKKVIENIKKVD